MKQLEKALQSPPQPGPSHDAVAPSAELPMEVAENKYEIVLQDIIASFDKHELYAGNFFANLKETEDNYMASLHWLVGLILYHRAGCGGFNYSGTLCMSVCLSV